MPLTHLELGGDLLTIEEATEFVSDRHNPTPWTLELLTAVLEANVAHPSHEDPSRISTTVLTSKCLRQVALERFNDFVSSPDALWASFRGTQFHGELEKYAKPPAYAEARFFIEDIGKLIPAVKKALPRQDRSFSGSPDLVDPEQGVLYDYKRTKEVPRWNTCWPDHIQQLNINRWLVDHADRVQCGGLGDIALVGDVRDFYIPDDWTSLVIVYVDDKGPKPIEATKSVDVPKVGGVGTKKARVSDIWSDEQCEEFIAERYIAARKALNEHTAPIPDGWEGQSHILCGYCPLRKLCGAMEREGK